MKKKISLLIIITLILQLVLNAFNNIAYATSTNKTTDEKRIQKVIGVKQMLLYFMELQK